MDLVVELQLVSSVFLVKSTSCEDVLQSQLKYTSDEVSWEIFFSIQ